MNITHTTGLDEALREQVAPDSPLNATLLAVGGLEGKNHRIRISAAEVQVNNYFAKLSPREVPLHDQVQRLNREQQDALHGTFR